MNPFSKQRAFYWTNPDVEDLLKGVKTKNITANDCIEEISKQYGLKHNRTTIHRHAQKLTVPIKQSHLADKTFECIWIKSKFLRNALAVGEEDGFRHFCKVKEKYSYSYYYCTACKNLKYRKKYSFNVPSIKEFEGRTTFNNAEHHVECKGVTESEIIAQQIDQDTREELRRNPLLNPKEAWLHGQRISEKLSRELNQDVESPDSIAAKFPTYNKVRKIYSRHRYQAKLDEELIKQEEEEEEEEYGDGGPEILFVDDKDAQKTDSSHKSIIKKENGYQEPEIIEVD